MPNNLILKITVILTEWIFFPTGIFLDPYPEFSVQLFALGEFFLRAMRFEEIEEIFRGLGAGN
jgi:hypothetical protein